MDYCFKNNRKKIHRQCNPPDKLHVILCPSEKSHCSTLLSRVVLSRSRWIHSVATTTDRNTTKHVPLADAAYLINTSLSSLWSPVWKFWNAVWLFLLIETIALFLVTSVRLHPNKYVFDVESPGLNSCRPPQKPSPQWRQTLNGVKFMSQLVFNPFSSPPFASSHTRLLGAQSSSVESLSILD